MIRDRIVVGIRNAKLSEKLQLDSNLTLDKALTQVRQSEAVKQQQPLLRGEGMRASAPVGAIQKPKHPAERKQLSRNPTQTTKPTTQCSWCGKVPSHNRKHCPAKDANCKKCGKKGHFMAVCRSVHSVREEIETSDEDAFLGAVNSSVTNKPWEISLCLNETPITFQIDTGAEVSIISKADHERIGSPSLSVPSKTLRGPNNKPLSVMGKIVVMMRSGDKETQQDVYVAETLFKPLLGQPAIEHLGLIKRVAEIGDNTEPEKQFPELFQGLGKLEGEYTIELQEGAEPYVLNTPRRVAIPLMQALKQELKRMEDLGVISKVEQPTDWCVGMVVVPKQNGKVRICVDLTKLNKSVRRERHILPDVEQTLAQLTGAKVLSTLDTNSGFWQIPLSEDSAKLTTFITPFGRYCFHRFHSESPQLQNISNVE